MSITIVTILVILFFMFSSGIFPKVKSQHLVLKKNPPDSKILDLRPGIPLTLNNAHNNIFLVRFKLSS